MAYSDWGLLLICNYQLRSDLAQRQLLTKLAKFFLVKLGSVGGRKPCNFRLGVFI